MAVLSQFPQINVSVHVNGRPAKEYPLPDGHGGHAAAHRDATVCTHECYVESQSGQNYTVEVSVAPDFFSSFPWSLRCLLTVDGRNLGAYILEPFRQPYQCSFVGSYVLSARSATSQSLMTEKLTFSPVTTVEESSQTRIERDDKIVARLGTIELEVSTCVITRYKFVRLSRQTNQGTTFNIAEKSLKGKELSHGTTFTKGDSVCPPLGCDMRDVKPFAKYIFRYRSISTLKREMIVPPGSPISDQVLSMTDDEVRSLAEKLLREKREQLVKTEDKASVERKRTIDHTGGDDDDDVEIIEVSGHGKVKVLKLENGCDAVDLT
ncbi:hypothetical protein E4U42_000197 [Claviceps africana]|uniref:DUF7918 domain-containing protein n=1 Tax=Claviceps africana TaxID=83212 RepID=A0A8K0JAY3_9HYPO|nr:hypothetical protein E4U42_000197 [Claviceps africana]